MIRIRVSDNGVAAGLQASKRIVTKEANRELREVVRRVTLPTARSIAPHKTGHLAGKMRAGAAGNRAYIENKSPYAGLIEFGGTRHDIIRPTKKKALVTPFGVFASVHGGTYTGQHKMQRAIDLTGGEVLDAQLDVIARAIATATGGTVSG